MAPKPRLAESWERVTNVMHRVAKVHHARAVVFGHTHHPFGSWNDGVFYGNCGSWSAAVSIESGELLVNERPLIWLTTDNDDNLSGGLYAWTRGAFEERVTKPIRRGECEAEQPAVCAPQTNGEAPCGPPMVDWPREAHVSRARNDCPDPDPHSN